MSLSSFFRSASSASARFSASASADPDGLTTLPPRRFSRLEPSPSPAPHLPASAPSHSPVAPDRASVVSQDWTSRHSFAELLSRDIPLDDEFLRDEEVSAILGGELGDGDGARETMIVVPGADFGVVELRRLRLSRAQKRRRRTGYVAGVLSLLVLVVTAWYQVETCWALIERGGSGRGKVRWVEMSAWLVVLLLWVFVLAFLRSHRISILSRLALASAAISSFLHLALALINFILSFVWRDTLNDRCDWGVDVSWLIAEKGDACLAEGWKGWSIAAAVRLILTVPVSLAWLVSLRRYSLALVTASIISPTQVPSSELASLLERHRARLIPLDRAVPPATSSVPPARIFDPDRLPAMPDRAAYYAEASDGAWSYSSARHGARAADTAADAPGASGGVAAWVGAKLWTGMGWLMGVPRFGSAPLSEDEKGDDAPEKAGAAGDEARLADLGRSATSTYGAADRPPQDGVPTSWWTHAETGDDYRPLFDGMRSSSPSSFISRSTKR
ncbi:uncharacterized protein JCM10292_006547 [Rhodotorula paludigena]|uniref:uncharacterized protein n=1 Tax=Rhodotorula paludigena TaxID=86838 RepID=UPI00317594BE